MKHHNIIIDIIKYYNKHEYVNISDMYVNENTDVLIVSYSYKEYGNVNWYKIRQNVHIRREDIRDFKINSVLV